MTAEVITATGAVQKFVLRLPGSGGGCDMRSLSKRMIIVTPHEKRRIVERVDFVTSPGLGQENVFQLSGGPPAVMTTMSVLGFDEKTKEMHLSSYHPGVSLDQVKQNTEWDLRIPPNVKQTEPPTVEEVGCSERSWIRKAIFLRRGVT